MFTKIPSQGLQKLIKPAAGDGTMLKNDEAKLNPELEGLIKDPGLSPTKSQQPARGTLHHPSLAPTTAGIVQQIEKQLSTGLLDLWVSRADALSALGLIEQLPAGDRAYAVETLGPDRLTTLVGVLSEEDRSEHKAALASLRSLRNAPGAPPEREGFLATAQKELRGLQEIHFLDSETARQLIDQLRRFEPSTFEEVLDALGPDKAYRLAACLDPVDTEIYAPTVDRFRDLFFGAVKRAEEQAGLGAKDTSAEFSQILAGVQGHELALGAEAKQYTYLLVPGLVTEHQIGYFSRNKQRLEERGLDVQISKIDTDASVEVNAKVLAQEITALAEKTGKKVVVFSHSKGGPDTALALRDPEAKKHAAFFVSLQAAYGGTPIGDPLSEGTLGDAVKQTLKLLRADGKAAVDLTYREQKRRWLNAPPLEVPVLSVATDADGAPSTLATVFGWWKRRFGIDSDGLVPTDSQIIGGRKAWAARLSGVDHTGPGSIPLLGFEQKYGGADLTEASILLALRLAKQVG